MELQQENKQNGKIPILTENNIEIVFYAIQRGKHFKKIIVFNIVKMTQYC